MKSVKKKKLRIGLQTWGSEGDVMPFVALAAGLTSAGHETTLVVSDNVGRDYGAFADRFGFNLVDVPNPAMSTAETFEQLWRQLIEAGNPIRQAELVMKYGFDPLVEPMFEAAGELCRTNDAVVGHFFVFPLHVAAEKAGVPLAKLNIVHNCLPSAEICPPGIPDIGKWFYPLGWKLARFMVNRIFLPRVNALRQRAGLVPDRDVMLESWASDTLNLVAVSPSICRTPADWDHSDRVCGFLNMPTETAAEEPPAGLEEFFAAGDPPVYFTFGSMMIHSLGFIREAFEIWKETADRLRCRAVFQLPWDDLSAFDTDDRFFKVGRAPYKTVFPKCSVIVHHGGAGTTQSSLAAGRPSVIVAHMADQFFWGSELERLGVAGPTCKRRGLDAAKLAKSIQMVLSSPEMADRAAALGASMALENGVETAVGLIGSTLKPKASAANH